MNPAQKTSEFLKISNQFNLGHLVTESFHPKTKNLAELVSTDISKALQLLQEVDRDALTLMETKIDSLWELASDIQMTLKKGHKVFMVGCGATGRLSLVLETLFRQKFGETNQVVSLMAGGDYALIKSVESFEDKTEYGERQLLELGFGTNDLLLAPTEGGETPFVLGAAMKATRVSSMKPYVLYCNPDELLHPLERCREFIESSEIKKVNLTVGPMAISGSTRMQASTVLMLGIGVGLLYEHRSKEEFREFYLKFLKGLTHTDYSVLAPFTASEAKVYQENRFISYVTGPYLGITLLTDTTERSPTFSLPGFENRLDEKYAPSLSYLFIPEAQTSEAAWEKLLWRSPRPVEWEELGGKINGEKLFGFDISNKGLEHRSQKLPVSLFSVRQVDDKVLFELEGNRVFFNWGGDILSTHLMVKMLLNAHSTLVMGLLGRYEGNVMTWVRPSNNKLIDRAARYIMQLLKENGKEPVYEVVIEQIFEEIENLKANDPVVLRVVARY